MKIYLITDTHFYHTKIIEFCGRPINFTELIGNNLLDIDVNGSDVLIHLGDISIGHDKEVHERYIQPLPCKKWLIKGNHDHQSNQWYIDHGWDFVGEQIRDKYFGKNIVFSHIPVKDDGYDLNIHGHFHNSEHRSQEPELLAIKNDKQLLLAIEYTNYKPVLLEDFIKLTNVSYYEER